MINIIWRLLVNFRHILCDFTSIKKLKYNKKLLQYKGVFVPYKSYDDGNNKNVTIQLITFGGVELKIKKIITLSLVIQILSFSVIYAEEAPKDKPGTAVFVMKSHDSPCLDVTGIVIQEERPGLTIDMKIPVIHHLNNWFFQKKINYQIKRQQLEMKKSIEQDAICNQIKPYTLMTNYHVKINSEIFSLETTTYDYRGGAHGLTTNIYYNIDTKNSKLLTLKDLFKADSDYENILTQEINRQIQERSKHGDVFFDDELGFKSVGPEQAFYINQDGHLIIVFGLYEIAPYASGIIEFDIPQKVIEDKVIDNIYPVLYNR